MPDALTNLGNFSGCVVNSAVLQKKKDNRHACKFHNVGV